MTTAKKLSIVYGAAIALVVLYSLLRIFVLTIAEVNGTSMFPTLREGEVLICRKVYDINDVKVGDIVVANMDNIRIVKRVAGKAGDTNVMSVDKTTVVCEQVPENSVFLLGDNYAESMDSRDFGPVNNEDIKYVWTGIRTTNVVWYGAVGTIIFVFILTTCLLEHKVDKEAKDAKITTDN